MARKREIGKKRKLRRFILSLILLAVIVTVGTRVLDGIKARQDRTLGYEDAVKEITAFAEKKGCDIDDYPSELISLYARNKDARQFVLDYPLHKDDIFEINLKKDVKGDGVPLFMQWDERWGYTKYGNGIIGLSACGPVALSMVAVYLTGDLSLDPKTVSEFSEKNGYYSWNNGTKWTLMSEGAEKLGLTAKELPLDKNIVARELNAGRPIICIMGAGDFTSSGHYIVLTGYSDGKVSVNDPNSYENSEKLWEFDAIADQIRNLWSYTV